MNQALLFFVTDGIGAYSKGEVPKSAGYRFVPKEEALRSARKMWFESKGVRRPHIHRIDAQTYGRRISEVWEWKPSDADLVELVEKALGARDEDDRRQANHMVERARQLRASKPPSEPKIMVGGAMGEALLRHLERK